MTIPEAPDPASPAIAVSHVGGAVVCVTVAGEVDAFTADRLRAGLVEVVDAYGPRSVVVDVAGVEFLDAAGVTALLLVREHAQRRRAGMWLMNTGRQVHRVLSVVGLAEIFAPPG